MKVCKTIVLIIRLFLAFCLFAGCWLERPKEGICSRARTTRVPCSSAQLRRGTMTAFKLLLMVEDVSQSAVHHLGSVLRGEVLN